MAAKLGWSLAVVIFGETAGETGGGNPGSDAGLSRRLAAGLLLGADIRGAGMKRAPSRASIALVPPHH